MTFTTAAFDRSSSWRFEALPTGRLRRVLLHLSYSMALSRLLDTTPPSLLTTAACGGLRPTPDCRPRRALLHLSYSSAPSYSDGAFVTHDPWRSRDPTRRIYDRPLAPPSRRSRFDLFGTCQTHREMDDRPGRN